MLDFQAARWLISGEVAQAGRQRTIRLLSRPAYSQGWTVNIAAAGTVWEAACTAIGANGAVVNPEYCNYAIAFAKCKMVKRQACRHYQDKPTPTGLKHSTRQHPLRCDQHDDQTFANHGCNTSVSHAREPPQLAYSGRST